MKRALHILGQEADAPPAEPRLLQIGSTTVIVKDTGDGTEARRVADWAIEAGARGLADAVPEDALRVVIDVRARTGQDLEEPAPDFLLGSARPAFVRELVSRLAELGTS